MTGSPVLQSLLLEIRQHPAFPELLAAVQVPQLPRFKESEAEKSEKSKSTWVFRSGMLKQHEVWLHTLTGRDDIDDLTT